jgi:glycerol-3-phosphate acyltransferase PlsY
MMMNEIKDYLLESPGVLILVSALVGYLFGSISFAKLIYFSVTGKWKMEPFSEPIPNSEDTFDSDLVSATTVGKKLGARYGCITSIGDMVKIALPVLLFKLWFSEEPYFLILTVFGVVGHNYPIFSGFVGGRGDSPILGALLVINWFGVLIANAAATILGFITGSVMVMRFGGIVLLIFWFCIYFQD